MDSDSIVWVRCFSERAKLSNPDPRVYAFVFTHKDIWPCAYFIELSLHL